MNFDFLLRPQRSNNMATFIPSSTALLSAKEFNDVVEVNTCRKEFPPTATRGTTTSAWSALHSRTPSDFIKFSGSY